MIEETSAWDQLKPNEQLFVAEYLKHSDARNGMLNYSGTEASRFMSRPLVKVAIHEKRRELAENANIEANKILREMALLAFANYADFVDTDTGSFEPSKMTRAQWACVKKIKRVEHLDREGYVSKVTTEVELHPKLTALSELMKYLDKYAPSVAKAMRDNNVAPAEAYARLINA